MTDSAATPEAQKENIPEASSQLCGLGSGQKFASLHLDCFFFFVFVVTKLPARTWIQVQTGLSTGFVTPVCVQERV